MLDLSFLEVRLGSTPVPARPVNVYEILREGWRETRVDMTLQFFLDPNERHGLGSLIIDALLRLLDGAPTIGVTGNSGAPFLAEDVIASDTWEITTQAAYIDVLAINRERGVGIVLENKIGHELNNPLDRYATHALNEDGIKTVVVAVLAPERRVARPEQAAWLSRAITYSELSEQIKRSPELVEYLFGPSNLDQRRSLDLLHQFIEARSGGTNLNDLAIEATRLDEWRALLSTHGPAIDEFFAAKRSIASLLRDRNKRLAPLIAVGLESVGLEVGWEAHGGSDTEYWNAYHFPRPDWTVELKLSSNPERPSIFVYDYRGRTYKDATIEPLRVEWVASDQHVADLFVARAQQIIADVEGGRRAN